MTGIKERTEVISADGVHLDNVHKIEGDRIKLTKAASGKGGLVTGVEGNKVSFLQPAPLP